MSLHVYLAAPYAARDGIRQYADELRSIGMTVTSSWLDEQDEIGAGTIDAATDLTDAAARAHVHKDFRDIGRCNVIVLFTAAASPIIGGTGHSGGRHIETGYALAKGKHVIVVGQPENIFHRTLDTFSDWHAAVLALVAHEKTLPSDYVAAP